MAPKLSSIINSSSLYEETHNSSISSEGEEEPYSLNGSFIALLGSTIAFATLGVPLIAIVSESPLEQETILPITHEIDGSKPTRPISLTRASKSSSRDSSRKQE